MFVILKHVMLALIGGVVAAVGFTWYLHREDPWNVQNRQPGAEDITMSVPSPEEMADKATEVLGPERVQRWLNGLLEQYLNESGQLSGEPAAAPDEPAAHSESRL